MRVESEESESRTMENTCIEEGEEVGAKRRRLDKRNGDIRC